jgi:LysR family nitrogen assimilation transcriptional regulator
MTDRVDPTALRAFCSVSEHGSLTRASAALEVAQSALSRRIAALERDLGVPLFHRNGRGVVATEAGERLLPRARAILAETGALIEDARGERSSPAGLVEIGLVPVVARPLVSALVQRLRRDYPRIRLRVTEGYSGQVEEWLVAGRIDLGLFNRYGRGSVRGAEPYLTSHIVLVTRREGSPLQGGTVPFRALEGLPLVMPSRPNPLVSVASDLAARQQFMLDIVLEAGSAAIVRDAVLEAGLATLAPEHLARREYPTASFLTARVVRPVLHQKTWLAFTTQRPAGLAVRAVGRLVREMAAGLARGDPKSGPTG